MGQGAKLERVENGSAFFVILIVIALLGLLTYAVTRGGSTSQSALTADQTRMAAEEIIAQGDTVAKATQKLLLSNGCTYLTMEYTNAVWKKFDGVSATNPANSNAPADGSCAVFGAAGQISATAFPDSYTNRSDSAPNLSAGHVNPGSSSVFVTGLPGIGSSKEEIFISTHYLSDNICMKINDILGVPNVSGRPPYLNMGAANYQAGAVDDTKVATDTDGVMSGKTAACIRWTTSAQPWRNMYFRVLITR